MRILYGGSILAVIALIVIHGVAPEDFTVDSTTVALMLVLGVIIAIPFLPVVTRYIAEFTIMGNTIKFREQVQRAEEQLQAVKAEQAREQKVQEGLGEEARKTWPKFFEVPTHLYDLMEQDPRLAVAGLGIEVERVLRDAASRMAESLDSDGDTRLRSLVSAIRFLEKRRTIDAEQALLLLQLVELRNLAVHGGEIEKQDAYRFFSIVEQLNDSVGLGYSVNFAPNEKWEEQGLTCKFEHCIENMPLRKKRWHGSCGLFAHDCPGGPKQVDECRAKGLFASHEEIADDPQA